MDKRYIYVGLFVSVSFLAMALITVLLLLNFLWNNNVTSGTKLVIDHDGGADDAMAIFIALIHEKYFDGPQVVALTTTFGNVNESQAFINTQKILHLANRRDIPIYRGSQSPFIEGIESDYYYGADGLGLCDTDYQPIDAQPDHAVQALVELSKKYKDTKFGKRMPQIMSLYTYLGSGNVVFQPPVKVETDNITAQNVLLGDLSIVAIASVTNIALAMKIDPVFLSRLDQLYLGAGYIHNPTFPGPEFNAAMDPEAYYMIGKQASANQVTVVPFTQIFEFMNLTKDWRQSTLGAIPTSTMQSLNCFERISMENSTDWTQLDPAVMALALNSSIVEEVRYAKNSIVLCGDKRGVNTNEFLPEKEANVRVIYSGNREKYQEFLINTFSAELKQT